MPHEQFVLFDAQQNNDGLEQPYHCMYGTRISLYRECRRQMFMSRQAGLGSHVCWGRVPSLELFRFWGGAVVHGVPNDVTEVKFWKGGRVAQANRGEDRHGEGGKGGGGGGGGGERERREVQTLRSAGREKTIKM